MQGEFYHQYNTPLTGQERSSLYDTLVNASIKQKRNVFNDFNDYDLAGAYVDNAIYELLNGGHGVDTYKKPNHPTFSNESKYSGVDGNVGGVWGEEDGKPTFTPSKTNLQYNPNLQEYMQEYEPDVQLVMPAHIIEWLKSGLR